MGREFIKLNKSLRTEKNIHTHSEIVRLMQLTVSC